MMGDTYAKVSENAVAALDGARFLQVQLVDGLTSYEQRDARD
jgi:hypothetical protein